VARKEFVDVDKPDDFHVERMMSATCLENEDGSREIGLFTCRDCAWLTPLYAAKFHAWLARAIAWQADASK
jgi:hypothetical protein